jgi:hypothetical protein
MFFCEFSVERKIRRIAQAKLVRFRGAKFKTRRQKGNHEQQNERTLVTEASKAKGGEG